MPKALFTFDARKDLKDIRDYIALDNKKAAIAYVKLLRNTITLLAQSPKIGAVE